MLSLLSDSASSEPSELSIPSSSAESIWAPPPAKSSPGIWAGRIVTLLTFVWILLCSVGAQTAAWLRIALGQAAGPLNPWLWASLAQAVLIGIPLAVLVWFWRAPRYRAIFQTWLLAAGYLLLLAPSRFLPAAEPQVLSLIQIGLSLIWLIILRRLRNAHARAGITPAELALVAATAAILVYPWLLWGAFGSPLDVVLSLAAGLVFGETAVTLIHTAWTPALAVDTRGPRRDLATGGFVAGTALLIMASAFSFNGMQLALMICLPSLGWVVMATATRLLPASPAANQRAAALLLGLAAAAPLLLVDTDAMNLIVLDPILGGAFLAAASALVLGWALGLATLLARRPGGRPANVRLVLGGAAILWAAAFIVYFSAGRTGFYGDHLFVILKDQSDVSSAKTMHDYDARRRYVYTTLVDHATKTQAGLRAVLDRLGIAYTPYYLVNGMEVRGGLPVRIWLSMRPEVDRVLPGPILRPPPWPQAIASGDAAQPTTPQWNLTHIGADRVWRDFGVTGQGIVVGRSDSGVQVDHPEFAARYRGVQGGKDSSNDYNWFDPWNGSTQPIDYDGHGTHTLGTILGKHTGVAPGATWFACANLVRNLGNPARYLDCMQFMLAPFPSHGDPFRDGDPTRAADVMNNSWGCPQEAEGCDPNSLLPAVRALRAAGIFVVASAGNDGPRCNTITDPIAIYGQVLSVGAVDAANNLASFSSEGPITVDGSGRTKPDVVAPGVNVLSAFPQSSYTYLDGTSMAGPM